MAAPALPPSGAVVPGMRWTQGRGTIRERGTRGLALVVALLLHIGFALVAWQQMRPRALAVADVAPSEMLQIRFISSVPAARVPAAPALPALPALPSLRARPATREPVRKEALSLQTHAVPPRDSMRIYDENGQPLLPAPAASVAPLPSYVQHLPAGDPRIMQHRSSVTYQPTRFEKDWGKSNAVDSALQKLVDKTTVKTTIRLPRGIRIHCGISLAMLAGGCGGDPPAPPSAKDGDERLSMAPARSLDGHAHAPKPPSEQACIDMYRAGKPLEWGCPVDTPNRAVDAELRERAAKAAKAAQRH